MILYPYIYIYNIINENIIVKNAKVVVFVSIINLNDSVEIVGGVLFVSIINANRIVRIVEEAGACMAFPTRTVHVEGWPERLQMTEDPS